MTKIANIIISGIILSTVVSCEDLSNEGPNRILQIFQDTPDGYRFPKWLQITTFVILLLIILISTVLIIVLSKNRAGPPRINEAIYCKLSAKMGKAFNDRSMLMEQGRMPGQNNKNLGDSMPGRSPRSMARGSGVKEIEMRRMSSGY